MQNIYLSKLNQMKSISKKLVLLLIFIFPLINMNSQSPLDKRINDLVDAMTTQEKINQLINSSFGGTSKNSRLGIPGFAMDDGPHGVRFAADGRNGRTATAFPTGIAMASTWDQNIALKVGEAMGIEFWAFNRNEQLGPCIDLCHDPRGGRSAESGGEDSYLAGHIGKNVAIGIQKSPIIATVKHFMGESKQVDRFHMNVLATDRWLMDFSGYNFRTVIQEGGVLSVMGAYNLINGDKCCESTTLLTTILRDRWGYPFYLVSDWDAIFDSQKAIKAGTDICMGSSKYATDLPGMVASGAVTIADLDKAVKHVLRAKIANGMLDYFPVGNATYAKTTDINAINKLAAQKSVILLKNEKKSDGTPILPLSKTGIKIALIGPNATGQNLNCYGSSETFPPYAISVKTGLENKIGASNVFYAQGCDVNSDVRTGFDAAKTLAATCDVVIFAGGLDATQEGEGYNTGNDRKFGSINLPGQQMLLIQQLSLINPNLVVVVQSGGVCGLNYCISNIKGLIYSFYAAQEAGTAIVDVIFGDYNPAGRMPVTMPKQDADLPSWVEDSFRKFTDNLDGGYRWFDEKNIIPEFAFGFGLSYSTFAYNNMVVSPVSMAGQPFTVSVDITNTGSISGEEVVQLYLTSPSTADVWMPKKQLRGFQRIALNSGETKTVIFKLKAEDFYFWNGLQYQGQSGNFTLKIGGSSDNLPLTQSIVLNDADKKPDLKITQIYSMPRYPLKGQVVSFYALVKNQGNAANSVSTPFNIDYKVNGVKEAGSDNITTIIAPGQVQLIASTAVWTSDQIAKTTLSGELAFNQSNVEWDATNNSFSRNFEIFDPTLDPRISNLAYHKSVATSSDYGTNVAANIVDGDLSTRWESARTDNESATIDLSLIAEITNVSINWEAAYAKSYKIESSMDGSTWTLLKTVSNGSGGTESHTVNSVQSHYIKITCTERIPINGIKYGFSIYEVVVNGTVLQSFPTVQLAPIESQLYLPFAKTIFNGSISGNPLVQEKLSYRWKQLSGPSIAQIEDTTSSVTIAKFSTAGVYQFRFTVGNDAGSNSTQFSITVSSPATGADLAFMKPTTCSGVESAFTGSDMAVDGNASTRWSSAFQDGQWWQIDLQHSIIPTNLSIIWEGAYAKSFNVQLSADNVNWQSFYTNSTFTGGTSTIQNTNSLAGRYFRVNCVQRATTYGSSFYTFSLNGNLVTSSNHVPLANAGNNISTIGDITLNGSSSTDIDNDPLTYKWEQIAGPSMSVISNLNSVINKLTNLKKGDYYFKLTVDDGKDADYDIVKVTSNPSTGIKDISNTEIIVYPNPVRDTFSIQSVENQHIDMVYIFNTNGKLIRIIPVGSTTVSLNGISTGEYFIRLLSKGEVRKVLQIVKE